MGEALPGTDHLESAGSRKRHSGYGIASFVISLVAILTLVLFFAAGLGVLTAGASSDSTMTAAGGMALFAFSICGAPLVGIVGIALGIMGIRDRDRKRSFAVVGLVLNSLIAVGLIGLYLASFLSTAFQAGEALDAATQDERSAAVTTVEAESTAIAPTELSDPGTRANPISAGSTAIFYVSSDRKVALTLRESLWGEAAEAIRNEDEEYITYGAHSGNVLVLARFEASYLSGPADSTWSINHSSDFQPEIRNVLDSVFSTSWRDALHGVMYPGGTVSGWVSFQVPDGTDPSEVRLRYSPGFSFLDRPEIWFSLVPEPGAD
ncbi:MAG: hypothetical protein GX657_11105 [Chloroflexi bacterium]|nr:hypothetical protein [Chloroflexota bacterium]